MSTLLGKAKRLSLLFGVEKDIPLQREPEAEALLWVLCCVQLLRSRGQPFSLRESYDTYPHLLDALPLRLEDYVPKGSFLLETSALQLRVLERAEYFNSPEDIGEYLAEVWRYRSSPKERKTFRGGLPTFVSSVIQRSEKVPAGQVRNVHRSVSVWSRKR